MFTIVKKALSVILLIFISFASLACVSINEPPKDNKPTTEVNVGGEHGVTVEKDRK